MHKLVSKAMPVLAVCGIGAGCGSSSSGGSPSANHWPFSAWQTALQVISCTLPWAARL